ncbi:hypothetical protein DYBT9623_04170 [Dyadobacter sp. CECT 9623]|uniref:Cyclic nucleotide-binding domain-containing protein n=1 Tax=Dyadobacter linearis TaxID=2823330 RepID=A0ABN7RFR4_9BACT|nr:Crp/Fnr family transcriptional regulator [Dyadobacter sp. CECT 9623]CAG5072490.1 hypothetical protein DYBT9623_04170 [Dyadobacter sp. CECT 9623]
MQNDDFKTIINHFLKRIPLTPEEQEYVCSLIKIRHLLPRQYLVQQGEVCRFESFVVKGFLRSFYVDSKGNDFTLHFAMEDWWISDSASFVREIPATRNIVALEPTTVLQLDKVSIEMLYRQVPVFERFWRIMNESACLAQDERILNAIMMSGAARYEALLSKYPGIEQRLPQRHIASYLGITPVFLSKIRKVKPAKSAEKLN